MTHKTKLISVALLAALAVPGVALARDGMMGGMGPDGHMGGPMGMGPHMDFAEIDANGDGKITQDELDAMKAKHFAEADANSDGKVTADEIQTQMAARMAERMARGARMMIAFADDNGDGALSADEMAAGPEGGMLMRLDKDGDGAVSQDEFDARGKMRKPRP
jgi:hypothetical protein